MRGFQIKSMEYQSSERICAYTGESKQNQINRPEAFKNERSNGRMETLNRML